MIENLQKSATVHNEAHDIESLKKTVKALKAENARLKTRKKYGLVWEEEKVREEFDERTENAYPMLIEDTSKAIITDPSKPTNLLIEGDNYHALTNLLYTHKEKVDVIKY